MPKVIKVISTASPIKVVSNLIAGAKGDPGPNVITSATDSDGTADLSVASLSVLSLTEGDVVIAGEDGELEGIAAVSASTPSTLLRRDSSGNAYVSSGKIASTSDIFEDSLRVAAWTNPWHFYGGFAIPEIEVTDPNDGLLTVVVDVTDTLTILQTPVPNIVSSLTITGMHPDYFLMPIFTSGTQINYISNEVITALSSNSSGYIAYLQQLSSVVTTSAGVLIIDSNEPPLNDEQLVAVNNAIQPLLELGWFLDIPLLPSPFQLSQWTAGDNTADPDAIVTRGDLVEGAYVPAIDGEHWITKNEFDEFQAIADVWPYINSVLNPDDTYTTTTIFGGVGYYQIQ